MLDNCTQTNTNILDKVHKNLKLQKTKTEKIFSTMIKKPVRLIDKGGVKSLILERNTSLKPLININKSTEFYPPKKVKVNIHTVLFPYKKIANDILYKNPVKQIIAQNKEKYSLPTLFSAKDDTRIRDTSSTFPLITPKHRRTQTVGGVVDIRGGIGKSGVNAKSLLGNYMTFVTPRVKEKKCLLLKSPTKSQEINLLNKLQNEKLKELIFK
jgi:hypothetical protein